MTIHVGTCPWTNEYLLDRILDFKGAVTNRKYLVRWTDYGPDADGWLPRSNLHPQAIKDYEQESGNYVADWPHRCDVWDLPCASATGMMKIHRSHMHKEEKAQNFKDTLTDLTMKKETN